MRHYKTMKVHFQAIPKGNTCLVKYGLEYEKIHESAPEPKEFHNFGINLFKHLGHHLSCANQIGRLVARPIDLICQTTITTYCIIKNELVSSLGVTS